MRQAARLTCSQSLVGDYFLPASCATMSVQAASVCVPQATTYAYSPPISSSSSRVTTLFSLPPRHICKRCPTCPYSATLSKPVCVAFRTHSSPPCCHTSYLSLHRSTHFHFLHTSIAEPYMQLRHTFTLLRHPSTHQAACKVALDPAMKLFRK